MPLFRLSNMPEADLWKMIGSDSFGHSTCSSSTPEECRYNWKASPPLVPQTIIARYGSVSMEDASVGIHSLLGISEMPSAPEANWIYFFQEMIRCALELGRVARSIRYLEKVPNRDEIPNSLLTLGRVMVNLSCGPFVYSDTGHAHISPKDEDGFSWLRPQICLRITTHLDDERNLQVAVVDLVRAARERPHMKGVVYGIAFSFFHCVIVRIDVDDQGAFMIKHTPALQFLPSFHTESLSTPGITALVRLGCLSEPLELLDTPPGKLLRNHPLNDMPLELWSHIAHYLFSVDDLVALGSVSPASWAVANDVLRYPHIGDVRIVHLRSNIMPLDKPAEFGVMLGRPGESSGLPGCMQLGRHREQPVRTLKSFARHCQYLDRNANNILKEGVICLKCEWEDSVVCACAGACKCLEGRPWAMPYVCKSVSIGQVSDDSESN